MQRKMVWICNKFGRIIKRKPSSDEDRLVLQNFKKKIIIYLNMKNSLFVTVIFVLLGVEAYGRYYMWTMEIREARCSFKGKKRSVCMRGCGSLFLFPPTQQVFRPSLTLVSFSLSLSLHSPYLSVHFFLLFFSLFISLFIVPLFSLSLSFFASSSIFLLPAFFLLLALSVSPSLHGVTLPCLACPVGQKLKERERERDDCSFGIQDWSFYFSATMNPCRVSLSLLYIFPSSSLAFAVGPLSSLGSPRCANSWGSSWENNTWTTVYIYVSSSF